MIDLFRPFMAPQAGLRVAELLRPDANGRIYVGQGPRVAEFESVFSELIGARVPVVAVSSCTAAIDLALHLAGVGPGDAVISTPMTCAATNTPIVRRGAHILWADVRNDTGLIDPMSVIRLLDGDEPVRAIVAVDWAGRLCDYAALRFRHVPVIQDAAHSLLAEPPAAPLVRPYLWSGSYTCWSFGPIKHLTTGSGGALWVRPHELARARLLRWYGLPRGTATPRMEEAGYRYQMDDIAATIGLTNLPHARSLVTRHRANAAWYGEQLRGLPGVELPPADAGSSWWLYCLLVEERDRFITFARERGVECALVHERNDMHPGLQEYVLNAADPRPGLDFFAAHEVAIPVGWWLTEADRAQIAEVVSAWAHHRTRVMA